MSQYVNVPRVIEARTGRVLFEPHSGLCDAEHAWGEGGQFSLTLRLFPDYSNSLTLHFDLDEGTVRLDEQVETHPLETAARLAQSEFARHDREAPAAGDQVPPAYPPKPPRLIASRWLDALAAVGVVLALAIAIAWAVSSS